MREDALEDKLVIIGVILPIGLLYVVLTLLQLLSEFIDEVVGDVNRLGVFEAACKVEAL
jgi:hypothetical protein